VLLRRPGLLPSDVSDTSMAEAGWRWLMGHEELPQWTYVWQDLLERPTVQQTSAMESSLIDAGCRWLAGRAAREDWPVVWTALARRPTRLGAIDRNRVIELGRGWLTDPANDQSRSFGHVIEGLLDLGCGDSVLGMGTDWLDRMSRHPSWSVIAAKAIAAAPNTSAAERWGRLLIAKILRDPFRKSLVQVETALRDIVERDLNNPIVDQLWHALQARPHDIAAQVERLATYQESGEPVEAHILERTSTIVLVLGVRARLVLPANVGMPSGDTLQVVVTRIDATRRRVFVRLRDDAVGSRSPMRRLRRDADETVQVGAIEHGRIDNFKEFGVFVEFRGFVGLLHKSRLPRGTNPAKDFQRGTRIKVFVSGIDEKGIHLSLVDEH
jgi:hypothetical protein